jgi:putative N6-adenine-specific DNA methylase
MRVDSFPATNLRRLAKNADRIAWELFLPAAKGLNIKVKSHRSRLYHTGAIAQALESGIAHRLKRVGRPLHPIPVPQTLYVRVVDDQVAISVDSSGDALYKRGFKSGPAHAPIRETLAATILLSAGYDGLMPLVDPMCGSGTFSLEAAMMAKHMAPGINRDFAFMGWPAYTENQWVFLKREAESRIEKLDRPRIFASDVDPATCKRLAATIDRNGLADAVRVAHKDFFHSRAAHYGRTPGLVTINPPYGIRLSSQRQADDLFLAICRHLTAHFRGWRIALVTPNRELARHLPFPAKQMPLFHGGLKLSLVTGTIDG